jgi:hypothetical protein
MVGSSEKNNEPKGFLISGEFFFFLRKYYRVSRRAVLQGRLLLFT